MKKHQKIIFLGLILIIILSSCDCFTHVTGYAVDYETGKPIKDVQVNMLIKDHRLENMGFIYDSLSVKERDSIIRTEGNEENWSFSVPSISAGVYTKAGALMTDSLGYFDLFYHSGFCPKYKIELIKDGYSDTILHMDSLSKNMRIKMKLD